jgi:hypothetical protein
MPFCCVLLTCTVGSFLNRLKSSDAQERASTISTLTNIQSVALQCSNRQIVFSNIIGEYCVIRCFRWCVLLLALVNVQAAWSVPSNGFSAYRHKMPPDLVADASQDRPVRLIVRYYDASIEADIQNAERSTPQDSLYKTKVSAFKARRYGDLKTRASANMDSARFSIERDYSHLPMNVVTVKGDAGLLRLLADPAVADVYRDIELHHFLAQSAPLIRSTDALNQTGYEGLNTMVVVLDSGVNYTFADFGGCTAPGVPANCRVKVAQDFAVQDNALDDNGHGTNVSGIVASIAQGTQLAVFDVFDGANANSSVVIQGINWAIANQATYKIFAINMSLGDSSQNASLCSNGFSNPFVTPIANAFSAGIMTVIASGNSGFTAGLAMPACTPKAVSVGAVYDSNVGGLNWGICTDNTTAADIVACFSNSASYLSLLAPGALITAAGSTLGGTSQATPHVAAAVAVLRGARPSESLTSTLNRLTSTGVQISDTRNDLTFRRIDLLTALGSVNDSFASDTALVGTTNQTLTTASAITSTQFSSKEAGEPNHAGNAGGKSVWFEWTAPAVGNLRIDTHGSNFDTLLAVYTGSNISALTPIASNNNDGSANGTSGLSFLAAAGTKYRIAVDGLNGASGNVVLNLRFDTNISSTGSSVKVPFMPNWSFFLMAFGLVVVSLATPKTLMPTR